MWCSEHRDTGQEEVVRVPAVLYVWAQVESEEIMGYTIYLYKEDGTKIESGFSCSYTTYANWLDSIPTELSDLWYKTAIFGDMQFELYKDQAHIIFRALMDRCWTVGIDTMSEDEEWMTTGLIDALELIIYHNGRLLAN